MHPRFTLTGLLHCVTFVALWLAIIVPAERYSRRMNSHGDSVVSVAASADGSTFGALMGDGSVLIWNKEGSLKQSLSTQATFGAELAMSFDGKLVSASPNEILEVSTRSVWLSLPTSVTSIAFSPTGERIAVINDVWAGPHTNWPTGKQRTGGPRYQVCALDRNGSTSVVSTGHSACFSPDGKRLAVIEEHYGKLGGTHVGIYDLASGTPASRSARLPMCTCLHWAPDGHSLAAVFSSHDKMDRPEYTVAKLGLAGGVAQSASVQTGSKIVPPRAYHTLAYLPDERALLVGAPLCGFTALDPDTLLPVAATDMSNVWHVAAGVHGDAFIAAEGHAVDLWDAVTLRPRLRVFEAAAPPNHMLPCCGLAVWLITFVARRKRLTQRSASARQESFFGLRKKLELVCSRVR